MPTIGVKRDILFKALGKCYTDDEFQTLCFSFGLELDEVTSEKQMITREQGEGAISRNDASEDVIYRIDIPANRYDLLCLEGLARGLLIFQQKIPIPTYKGIECAEGSRQKMIILSDTARIRPYVVCAVLRDLYFTQDSYNSFIDLQDKLHQNICRKRSLVSIGTHDLDTLEGPFYYDAKPPSEIKFIPLNQNREFTGDEIMELFSTHTQLKQYLPIIKDSPVYPIITDRKGVVLSLPPIINGNHSRITLDTKNVFIEVTATDLTKAKVVLDTLVCMFSQYCKEKYSVEYCDVEYPDGTINRCPELKYREDVVNVNKTNGCVGISESSERIANLLSKMCLKSEVSSSGQEINVIVPPTRHDIIHVCDIYEDVAIAFGYNKIQRTLPKSSTIGQQQPVNKLSDLLRGPIAQAGFTEALTFSLCSRDDISTKLGIAIESVQAVHISNPKTLEFQVCRTTLLPGLLKTLSANRKLQLPIKIFEISDIVIKDSASEVGARNERKVCAINCNKTAGFEIVHGLLDKIMSLLEVPWDANKIGKGYYLQMVDDPAYFPQRCAVVMYKDRVLGKIGVLHPNVLAKFDLINPCSCVEISIEPFV